jgi:predicted phosphodiesterase
MDNKSKIALLGDTHGDFKNINKICYRNPDYKILIIGDVGLGFTPKDPVLPDNLFIMRGNHDNPKSFVDHPRFVGDYGLWENMFIVGGAFSIDRIWRTKDIDWWADEEMTNDEMDKALESYKQHKPKIIISHECPWHIYKVMTELAIVRNPNCRQWGEPKPNRTACLLDRMYQIHRPKFHFFGHHHCSLRFKANNTIYRCLDIMEFLPLNNLYET